jgi:hypothetical protein
MPFELYDDYKPRSYVPSLAESSDGNWCCIDHYDAACCARFMTSEALLPALSKMYTAPITRYSHLQCQSQQHKIRHFARTHTHTHTHTMHTYFCKNVLGSCASASALASVLALVDFDGGVYNRGLHHHGRSRYQPQASLW